MREAEERETPLFALSFVFTVSFTVHVKVSSRFYTACVEDNAHIKCSKSIKFNEIYSRLSP